MPDISIIIVTLKSIDEIRCLTELDLTDAEVIIRDDPGICKARNAGIKQSSTDKLIFLDDDAAPTAGYLDVARNALEKHRAVAGKVTHPDHSVISEFPTWYDQGSQGQYTNTIVGCNMAFDKGIFEEVGMFDERFEWGHDETDLAIRLAAVGVPIWYEPKLRVKHPYADGIFDYWRKMWAYGSADIKMYRKHGLSPTQFVKMAFPISPSDSVSGTIIKSVGKFIRNVSKLNETVRKT